MTPFDDHLTLVLPTDSIVRELFETLSMMSVPSYDDKELFSLSISALAVRDEAQLRIAEYAGEYQRLARIGQFTEFNRDVEILSNAWLVFTTKLFKIYDALCLWDERNCANYYFNGLIGYDVVLTLHPTDYPRVSRYAHSP